MSNSAFIAVLGLLLSTFAFLFYISAWNLSGPFSFRKILRRDQIDPQVLFKVLGLLQKVARVDRKVELDESKAIEQALVQLFDVKPERLPEAMAIVRELGYGVQSASSLAAMIRSAIGNSPLLLTNLLFAVLSVIYADGTLHAQEEELFRRICEVLGVSVPEAAALRARFEAEYLVEEESRERRSDSTGQRSGNRLAAEPGNADDKYYAVLDCKRTDPLTKIKKQYRKLVKECHPDRAPRGTPTELLTQMRARFITIQEAYDRICSLRSVSPH